MAKRRARARVPQNPPARRECGHDDVTAVDLPGAIRLADGRIKPRVPCCGGTGFVSDLLDEPYVTPCWCPAGLRMKCATEASAWPLTADVAAIIAAEIGLEVAHA